MIELIPLIDITDIQLDSKGAVFFSCKVNTIPTSRVELVLPNVLLRARYHPFAVPIHHLRNTSQIPPALGIPTFIT